MATITPYQLRQALDQYFNLGELRSLCFDLGIDYENLAGESKRGKTLALVQYAERHGRLPDLMGYVQSARPHLRLTELDGGEHENGRSVPPAAASPPAVQYNIYGDVTGSAIGEGSSVSAQQIAGGDIIMSAPIETKETFLEELGTVKGLLEQAAAAKEFANRRDGQTAVEDIEDAISEAKHASPRPNRIIRRLEDVQEIVEESGKLVETSRRAGSALLKALPIVVRLVQAIGLVFAG